MKVKAWKFASFIIALLVAVFTVGYAFAWFIDRADSSLNISGASAGAYFDSTSGDGLSAEEPFVISNSTHMRNLAVLQNTGRFGTTKYYFEIKKDVDFIDMSDMYSDLWLPPIGNDGNPFNGEFNGNGKTILNLKVTTDKSLLDEERYPTQAAAGYKFSQAVGLFGNTGADSNIYNFILDNPHVLVGAESTTAYGTDAKKVVGIAVGHVAGKCRSIGVRAGNAGAGTADGEGSTSLDVRVTGYTTFNSILGELGEGVESSVTGGGHNAGTGGSGASFGSSFDVDGLRDRMKNILANNEASKFLPPVEYDSSSHRYNLKNRNKLPFSIDSNASKYDGATAREVVSAQNIGYILGNQTKIYDTTLTFTQPMSYDANANNGQYYTSKTTGSDGTVTYKTPTSTSVPSWLYKNINLWDGGKYDTNNTGYTSGAGFSALTEEEFNELPQNVKDVIPSKDSDGKYGSATFATIRLSETYQYQENASSNGAIPQNNNAGWAYQGQISWMGKTYGEGFRNPANGKLMDENGNYLDASGNVVATSDAAEDFYKYSGGIALPNTAIWFKPSQTGKIRFVMYAESAGDGFVLIKVTRKNATKENPFYLDPAKGGADAIYTVVMRQEMPSNVLLYYEYDVTDDVAAGNVDYLLMKHGSGGAYFVYLDVGASAAEDTSGVVPDKVSAVDFIYDGVEISQTDLEGTDIKVGDFIVGAGGAAARYDSSKTSVYFEDIKMVLKVVYVRLHNDETDGHSGKTVCLEYSDPLPDINSEVKATYATYVCPTVSGGSGSVSGGGTVTPTPTPTVTGMTVTPESATLTAGETFVFTASVTMSDGSAYGGNAVWTSSDESIATVENGTVTAKAAGTVTITATADGKSASVTVTVEAAPDPAPDVGTYEFIHGVANGEKWKSNSSDTSTTTDNAYTGTKLSNSTYVILNASGTKATVSLKGFTRSTSSAVNVKVEFLGADGTVLGSLSGVTLANKEYGDIALTAGVFESATPFASVRIYCADASRTFALVSASIIIE